MITRHDLGDLGVVVALTVTDAPATCIPRYRYALGKAR